MDNATVLLRKKAIFILLLVGLSINTTYGQDIKSFYTSNGKLFDANDSVFIIRGVNNPHTWFPNQSLAALDTIAGLRCNAVRIVWQIRDTPEHLREVIQKVVDLKMIAIPEIHDATGDNAISDLEAAANYWARDDIKVILNDFKPYVILNIANEWMQSNDAANWFNGYKSAISIVRNAGLHHCLLIDAAGWGQDLGPTKLHAMELLDHDPDSNLLFDVHMYGSWNSNSKIDTELKYFVDNKLALLVGEFGYNYDNGNNNLGCRVDAPYLLQKCEEYSIGYMPWSWSGNNEINQWLDMVTFADWKTLTDWGELVVYGENGIYNTSRPCSLFGTDTTHRNSPPYTIGSIGDYCNYMNSGNANGYANLHTIFSDDSDSASLEFSVYSNTNDSLIIPTIENGLLNLNFTADVSGNAQITIKAADKQGRTTSTLFRVFIIDSTNENKALYQNISASSYESNNYIELLCNDGNLNTRWSSSYKDNEYLIFKFDTIYTIKKAVFYWEAAYGKDYDIQVSDSGKNWITVASVTNSNGATDKILIEPSVPCRFIKIDLKQRATEWGFSLWEVQFFENKDNMAPVAQVILPDKEINAGDLLIYTIPQNAFSDDGDEITLGAFLEGTESLPEWLDFEVENMRLFGTPLEENTGEYPIILKAVDSFGASDSIKFKIFVNSSLGLNNSEAQSFFVYPIPVEQQLNIILQDIDARELCVYNMLGNKISTIEITSNVKTYTLSVDYPKGLYFVALRKNSGKIEVLKVYVK